LKAFENLLIPKISGSGSTEDAQQFAFRKSRSTLDAVAYLVHSIASILDKKRRTVRFLFLDYKDAFGSVDRATLLDILHSKGVHSNVCRIICDYFQYRTQFTCFEGRSSSNTTVNTGVLQGAILSPLFFSMYVNQLPISPEFIGCKYADDVVVGCEILNHANDRRLHNGLTNIINWSSYHYLTLNPLKCQDMLFSLLPTESHRTLHESFQPFFIDDQLVPPTLSSKYLGIILTHNLSWSPHVIHTFCNVRKLCFFALRLRTLRVPYALILRFVNACILPHWLYCSPVIYPGLLKKDYNLFNRSIKFISKCSGVSRKLLVETITIRHKRCCEQLSSKIISDSSHPLHKELSFAFSIPSTRSKYKLLASRTSIYRNSFLPYIARFLVSPESVIEDLGFQLLQ
jgi:hypothetical protein